VTMSHPPVDHACPSSTTLNVLLSIVEGLNGHTDERTQVTWCSPMQNVMRQHGNLELDALRDAQPVCKLASASVRLCGRSDIAERSSVQTH